MSVYSMQWSYEQDLQPHLKHILLILSDIAMPDGYIGDLDIEDLASKSGQSIYILFEILQDLTETGHLERDGDRFTLSI